MANNYQNGDLIRCSGSWVNSSGDYTDPDAVYFKFKDPSGNSTTYQYGVDGELLKDDTGQYHVDVDADEVGVWTYRFYSTGSGQAAAEEYFTIDPSGF